jgi:hypothetical protein
MRRSDRPSIQLLGRIMAGTEKRSRSNKETDDGGRGYAVGTRCIRVGALLTPPYKRRGSERTGLWPVVSPLCTVLES